jgi:hypothetical protein
VEAKIEREKAQVLRLGPAQALWQRVILDVAWKFPWNLAAFNFQTAVQVLCPDCRAIRSAPDRCRFANGNIGAVSFATLRMITNRPNALFSEAECLEVCSGRAPATKRRALI